MSESTVMIEVRELAKTFVLHNQGSVEIPVFSGLSLSVSAGECLALHGASGSGKSTLLRSLYGNYKPGAGSIGILHRGARVDIVGAAARMVLQVRRETVGYVSQFLTAIPRVSALDIVAEPLVEQGEPLGRARERAREMLARLRIPERLWDVAPRTFSGGEQQRVNIARGFIRRYPVLLLDEPTASLDAANRATVVELIHEAGAAGAAVVGIFHDDEVRRAVAGRVFDMQSMECAA